MKTLSIFIFLLTSAATHAQIKVTSADWGGRDVTPQAARFCDGKMECEYKVHPKFLGDAGSSNRTFEMRWSCEGSAASKAHTVPHDASGQVFKIACDAKPVAPAPVATPAPVSTPAPVPAPVPAPAPVLRPAPSMSGWTPSSPYDVPVSFHAFIKDPGQDSVELAIGRTGGECVRKLREHLKAGHTFESAPLEKYLLPLSKFASPLARSGVFHHYTNAPAVAAIAKSSKYDDLFMHVRTNAKTGFSGQTVGLFFYVATDAVSTKGYGGIHTKPQFDPETLVLISAGDMPSGTGAPPTNHVEVVRQIESDILRRYPDLSVCVSRETEVWSNGILTLLAAEARGVGLIAYFGIDNRAVGSANQWFQVLGPWAIQKMELEQ